VKSVITLYFSTKNVKVGKELFKKSFMTKQLPKIRFFRPVRLLHEKLVRCIPGIVYVVNSS
jgi:hypothetical protein